MAHLKLTLLVIFMLLAGTSFSQVPMDCLNAENTAFNPGEKIVYKVVYNWNSLWLNAGEVTFTVYDETYNNKPVYHFIGEGNTYKSYDWFYKVRDKYESFVDKETLQPLKFLRDVNEGGYTIYNNVTFKHAENKAISTHGTYTIPDCIQDVLSAIYWSRNIDFSKYAPNDLIPLTIFLDDSVYPLYIRYLGKETLTTKDGTYKCIVFKPLLIEGTIFTGGEKMMVWVTDDANKIPVRIESPIVVGSIKAELYKTSGLRYPMTAKIK